MKDQTSPGFGAILGWALVVTFFVLTLYLWPRHGDEVGPVSKHDQSRAAASLLAEKLSGPGYFVAPEGTPVDESGPWISPAEALRQLPSVITERKLPAGLRADLEKIIADLTEEPPSRITGAARVNLSRLNLSLDKLPLH